MAFKDLFTKKNTTDNLAGSCCNVEIVPDNDPAQAAPEGQATDQRDFPRGH